MTGVVIRFALTPKIVCKRTFQSLEPRKHSKVESRISSKQALPVARHPVNLGPFLKGPLQAWGGLRVRCLLLREHPKPFHRLLSLSFDYVQHGQTVIGLGVDFLPSAGMSMGHDGADPYQLDP